MNSDNTTLLDEPRAVDVVSIERELTLLWKKAAFTPEDEISAPVTRACSLNLVVIAEGEKDIEEFSETVAEVTVEHPGRTFLVAADRRESAPSLAAWISARCSVPVPGGKQVCCEQINLVAKGADAGRIPSVVTSLLVSDVPTVLLWKAPLDRSDEIVTSLLDVADRVLFDSSEESDPLRTLALWEEIGKEKDRLVLGDLSWTRLHPWRSMIARVFEPGDMRRVLGSLTECNIEFSMAQDRRSGLAQSLLMAGWIANRLGWVLVRPWTRLSDGGCTALLRAGEHAIAVRISRSGAREVTAGAIESVQLVSRAGVTVGLHHVPAENSVHLSVAVAGSPRREVLPLNEQNEASILARELDELNRDTLFEQTLAYVLSLTKEPRDANAP